MAEPTIDSTPTGGSSKPKEAAPPTALVAAASLTRRPAVTQSRTQRLPRSKRLLALAPLSRSTPGTSGTPRTSRRVARMPPPTLCKVLAHE